MRRRGKAGGKPVKPRRCKTLRRRNAAKTLRRRSSAATAKTNVARLSRERNEALEQQAATYDVLKVISRSTFDLQAVLATLVHSAGSLCKADNAQIFLRDGEFYRLAADNGFSPEYQQYLREHPIPPGRGSLVARTALLGVTVHLPDAMADSEYTWHEGRRLGGYRTMLGVPLVRDGNCIGVMALTRSQVQPFTDKQIGLVQNFAAQAVIAIENTRLLSELRQRTDDLTESLEQQTATSEVLKVISSSAGELEPVFQTMLTNATRICEAAFGSMLLSEGELLRRVAIHNPPPKFVEFHKNTPIIDPRKIPDLKLVVETKRPVHTVDAAAENLDNPIVKYAGARSLLVVPLLKDGDLLGAIGIYRQEVRPFTNKQIELVTNFAAQAVIAIENTRLLNELRESLQQQTATSEVLGVISSSPTDVRPVFETIANSSVNLCGATYCIVYSFDGEMISVVAHHNLDRAALDALNEIWPMRPDLRSVVGRTILERDVLHIEDVAAELNYTFANARRTALGIRTYLGVPMMREGQPIGAIALYRRAVKPFSDRQIELVKAFADQAVIAIENVRLFERVEARTRELAKSLDDLRTTQDRLVQTQKLASLGQLTAGIAHEIKNPLNFVNNFSGVSAELIDELQDALKGLTIDPKTRAEINELTDTLRGNLNKVVQHGKRADAIVKNMLLHSREGSGEHRLVDINALVEEGLNLAYHGARAEKQGFNITLERSFDPTAGEIDVFPQDITRALLNFILNGFYAATKRRAEGNGADYEPTLAAATKSLGDRVEIRIRDNGTGIPPEVKEKMFNPFFTTKPAGEGTGLGLSISHDIVVKQHGGVIEVDTRPGEFTEIRVILPRAVALLPERS